jgi:hypothetical protein
MAVKDSLLPEFDHEMGTTRRILERVPEGDMAWKPHAKSFSLGQLASHIANIPSWVNATFDVTVFDLATLGDDARPKQPAEMAPILAGFDANVKQARTKVNDQLDAAFLTPWTLKQNGEEVFTMLRNVPLPSIYGPTADEG